jgi:prophage maintenance system killer protein
MASLHYLTIQDILWINLQITKKVRHFNYARLEEAVFYQYAYGESRTLFPQAARFITGFLKMRPFDAGNEATALVACLAFLDINGYTTKELGDWFERVSRKQIEGVAAIEEIAVASEESHEALVPDVRNAVMAVIERNAELIESLESAERKSA